MTPLHLPPALRLSFLSLLLAGTLGGLSPARADPPGRVGRLAELGGEVSFSPAGESDWDQATQNRPMTPGDRLWTEAGAHAELQLGGAVLRLAGSTGLSVLNLDDQITQIQLSQGTLQVQVRSLQSGQTVEVDTPNLAFTLRQPGHYRIDVDAEGVATRIQVRSGQGEASGEGVAYVVDRLQAYRFTGTQLQDPEAISASPSDAFDHWAAERDRALEQSVSARYVSSEVVGYQDLDSQGTWGNDPRYGSVWTPSHVAADWAPYQSGHWSWIDPWGWTWVDNAPWGFAVSHYGRWARLGPRWGWVPGPRQSRAYYAPALVVFVGGSDFQLRVKVGAGPVRGVAWFPLAPREIYRPVYPVSQRYFEHLNRSNTQVNVADIHTTVVNNLVVHNDYRVTRIVDNSVHIRVNKQVNKQVNKNVTRIIYANRGVPGAVVAMPAEDFAQSRPVGRDHHPGAEHGKGLADDAPLAGLPHVAPTAVSVHGAAARRAAPIGQGPVHAVVARAKPPAVHAGFAAQAAQLASRQGQPLGDAERRQLAPPATRPDGAAQVHQATIPREPTRHLRATTPQERAAGAKGAAPGASAAAAGHANESAAKAAQAAGPANPASPVRPSQAPPMGTRLTPPSPAASAHTRPNTHPNTNPAKPDHPTPVPAERKGAEKPAPGKPDQADKPAQAERPAQRDKPDQADKPALGDRPAQRDKPAQADRPAQAYRPAQHDKPAQVDRPAPADRPAQRDRPAQADRPAQRQQRPADEPSTPPSPGAPPSAIQGHGGATGAAAAARREAREAREDRRDDKLNDPPRRER